MTEAEDILPTSGAPAPVKLYGPRFQHDPAELYREMRRTFGPVAPVSLQGDIPAWLVLGYRELHQVASSPHLFTRDPRHWHSIESIPPDWPQLPWVSYTPSISFAEGTEHRRHVDGLVDALGSVDHFELRARCVWIADRLVDEFIGRGEADLMASYANLVPVEILAYLLGIAKGEIPDLVRNFGVAMDGGPGAREAFQRVIKATRRLAESKRYQPGPDLLSRLLAHKGQFTVEEADADTQVLLVAGQNTADWIGNTLRLMLTDRRFAASLSGGRSTVGQALSEVLWEDPPMQNFLGRWALRDTQLGGQRIRTGDMLILGFAAANADPRVRSGSRARAGNQAHLAFGHGAHRCPLPAIEQAEIIARTAIEVLLDRLPDMRLAVSPDALVWRPSAWVRGLSALPVTFTPAYQSSR